MLDLDAGVHLDEVERARGVEHEFDGAGVHVAGRARRADRRLAHARTELGRELARRGLLDHLLAAALDRAVALAQLNHVAMGVCHDLELYVMRVQDELLEVHLVVVKARARLGAGLLKEVLKLRGVKDAAHTAAATARRGLDEDGIADLLGNLGARFSVRHAAVGAGNHGHARALHELARGGLVAHLLDDLGRRAYEGNALGRATAGKVGVLGKETVTGVDGVAVGRLGDGENRVDVEVALCGGRRANAIGVLGKLHVQRLAVRLGVHHHGLDVELTARAEDADGDLPAVCDQNTLEHGGPVSPRDSG